MTDQATQRAIIHAAPERCFAVAADFARYPEWASDVKQATVLTRDAEGRGGEVEYRAAALGRSTTYVLRYNYGSNPLRLSWRLIRGDLMHRLDGEYEAKPFWYWDKGNVAIVGRTFAVADLKHVRFAGFIAWLLWAGIHIYFLIGFANRLLVMFQWAISFLTKRRGVRILPLAREETTLRHQSRSR